MKIDISCDHAKPVSKTGAKDKCNCKHLNRNFRREFKLYKAFLKGLEKNGK